MAVAVAVAIVASTRDNDAAGGVASLPSQAKPGRARFLLSNLISLAGRAKFKFLALSARPPARSLAEAGQPESLSARGEQLAPGHNLVRLCHVAT